LHLIKSVSLGETESRVKLVSSVSKEITNSDSGNAVQALNFKIDYAATFSYVVTMQCVGHDQHHRETE